MRKARVEERGLQGHLRIVVWLISRLWEGGSYPSVKPTVRAGVKTANPVCQAHHKRLTYPEPDSSCRTIPLPSSSSILQLQQADRLGISELPRDIQELTTSPQKHSYQHTSRETKAHGEYPPECRQEQNDRSTTVFVSYGSVEWRYDSFIHHQT